MLELVIQPVRAKLVTCLTHSYWTVEFFEFKGLEQCISRPKLSRAMHFLPSQMAISIYFQAISIEVDMCCIKPVLGCFSVNWHVFRPM